MGFAICLNLGVYRDRHQKCLTCTFTVLLVLLLLFTMGWLMVLSMFLGSDMFEFDQMSMKPIHKLGVVYLFLGLAILLVIMCSGYKLNRMEQPKNWMVALFGIFTFVFGVIPFFSQARAIAYLGSITEEDLSKQCKIIQGIEQPMGWGKGRGGRKRGDGGKGKHPIKRNKYL